MKISDILTRDRIVCDVSSSSKKAALESLAALIAAADHEITQAEVFESLVARERLGSTGLGQGIALPHGRTKGGHKTLGAFMRLQSGIPYDAIDQKPVDLFFALLVPEESTQEHLEILSRLAGMFSNDEIVSKIRSCDSAEAVYNILAEQA